MTAGPRVHREEWPSPMTGAGADAALFAINAGVSVADARAAADRLIAAIRDGVLPCDEPDPIPIPAALVALDELILQLTAIEARLEQAQFAMHLAHDSDEEFSDAQIAEIQNATDALSDALFEYWDQTGAPRS